MIEIIKYTSNYKKQWDEFVDNSNNGTLFQLRKFLSYHIEKKFLDHSLLFFKDKKLISVLPATIVFKNKRKILRSHPGASFGGFVYNKISYHFLNELVDAFFNYCYKNHFNKIFMILTPKYYHNFEEETLEYILLYKKWSIDENYVSSVLNINFKLADIIKNINKQKNRSLKYFDNLIDNNNLHLSWDGCLDDFYPILLKNKSKHNALPTHSKKELNLLINLFPDKIKLLVLYKNKIPIGGTLVFLLSKKVLLVFYNMIDYNYKKLHPAELQIIESIKLAKRLNCNFLDLGVSQDPKAEDPLTPLPDLIRFKEEFGALSMLRKRYTLTIKNDEN